MNSAAVTKTCIKCLASKPVTDFGLRAKGATERQSACKACQSASSREWYLANAEVVRERVGRRYAAIRSDPERWFVHSLRNSARQRGLDPDLVVARFEGHDGLCDSCGEPNTTHHGRLFIDHDHATGELRGLLCHGCNSAIGLLRDSPGLLMRAASYLEQR